ncbi:S-adenosyl-L-methionine-dependent methyltransferase [Panaeolus papilionaceus]|nr:S-adenosyl-L-methionine-dependent methyltransferase [Panaeolus papilionaceus]
MDTDNLDIDYDGVAAQLGDELIEKIFQNEPLASISVFLDEGAPVWYQNLAEGISPLHAAAYMQNLPVVKLLLEKGAVWNAVDYLKNTAGDIALSFNHTEIYNLIRDTGIRSELLLGMLGSRSQNASSLILQEIDPSATGASDAFLSSKLNYTSDEFGQAICTVQVGSESIGVMMGWERPIMQETVSLLCGNHPKASSLRVLNVGFGLGIIDELFQSLPTQPLEHVIIEAHPDVLAYMRRNGWYGKAGVKILQGRWQDFVDSPQLLSGGGFDVVYTDTFSENYSDLRQFFESCPNLLADSHSVLGFFNGLGATNALFYDVYTHVSELDLERVGMSTSWTDVDVLPGGKHSVRWADSRDYFSLPIYRLPICKKKCVE